jgi:hypothetical protein
MSLLIALPGPPSWRNATSAPDALPALPALTRLLARGRRLAAANDWRGGVLDALCGAGAGGAIPHVAVAARAVPVAPLDTALCFAAPLHAVAGISRVHLPPGGWLRVSAAEAAQWTDAFNHEFAGPDLRLHAAAGGWLLAASFAHGARDAAPEDLLGEPLARAPAQDLAERAIRRLGAETEIWLKDHALNRAREARGLLPINSLWFWGGARMMELPPPLHRLRAVQVAGEADAWLAGLAAHCAVPLGNAAIWPPTAASTDTLLVLAPPREGSTIEHWQQLETRWFVPAEAALRRGELRSLRLQIGPSAWRLPATDPLRWLRRARPWHQLVRA